MKQIKKTTRIFFSLLIAGAFLFTACEKNPSIPDTGNGPAKKLTRIDYDNGSYESIEYNGNGTISKITNHTEYFGGNPSSTVYTFAYNGEEVTELTGSDGSKYKYTYNNTQQVIKTEISVAGGNLKARYEYTYKNGKLWRTEAFIRTTGAGMPNSPTFRYENEYHASGNLSKMMLYYPGQGGNLEKINDFIFDNYDQKINTFVQFENNPFLPMANLLPNNPLTEVHYDRDANVEELVTHTYTYDAAGNPLTRKTVSKIPGQAEQTETAVFRY